MYATSDGRTTDTDHRLMPPPPTGRGHNNNSSLKLIGHAIPMNYDHCCSGDSGYPLEPWLLTQLNAPTCPAETAYNAAHSKTRAVIERCFGLWKSRFRCLDKSGGTLLYSAEKTCQLVTATAVLHNYCISRNITATLDESVVARDAAIQPTTAPHNHGSLNAVELRRRIVQQF